MTAAGLCVAGLVTGPRDLVSYLAARRTGVCRRRGFRDVVVRRDEEPDRFRRLLRNRLLGMVNGFGLIAAGVALGLFILAVRMGWISAYAARFAPPPHATVGSALRSGV